MAGILPCALLVALGLPLPFPATVNQHPSRKPHLPRHHHVLLASTDSAIAEPALRLGDKWWLEDAKEGDRQPYGPSYLRWFSFVGLVGAICISSIVHFSQAGALKWATTPAHIASSSVVSHRVLTFWRLAAAAGVSALSINRCLCSSTGALEDLDRKTRTFTYDGIWRFQGLTGWSWLLINAYFLLAAAITIWPGAAPLVPSVGANVAQALLGTAFAFALLVTTVVTFVLVPNRHANGLSIAEYFRFQALVMHNANVALMGAELWLSGLPVHLHQLPLALSFGVLYLCYHNGFRFLKTRTLLYFFLNWTRPDALRILLVLLGTFGAFFTSGHVLSLALRKYTTWGPAALALALASIMKVRPPPPGAVDLNRSTTL
jgi:hypothetical protein